MKEPIIDDTCYLNIADITLVYSHMKVLEIIIKLKYHNFDGVNSSFLVFALEIIPYLVKVHPIKSRSVMKHG
jgi:hypothetical protein